MSDLDQPISTFRAQLHRVVDQIADLYGNIDDAAVYTNPDAQIVASIFEEPLPELEVPVDDLIRMVSNHVFENSALHFSPHFYAWVTSSATQVSIIGEILAAALNVNATTWMNSAAASEIEKNVIEWIGQFVGYSPKASGVLLSGGSTANLTGLNMARRLKGSSDISDSGLVDGKRYIVYASGQTHFCIDRAVDLLGIGKQQLRKIPTLPDYTIDLFQLENRIKEDLSLGHKPICIVANAGTVNTGAVDPMDKISALCKKYDLWMHVDAAYGGCAANLTTTKTLFRGLEHADSIAVDLHKWLFVPFEAGCILVKDRAHLKDTYSVIPEYQKFHNLGDEQMDFSEYSFQQSRSFKALKIWMNFKAYGRDRLMKAIEGSIVVMQDLSTMIGASTDFELIASGLSIVCFRYISSEGDIDEARLNDMNLEIVHRTEADKRIFIRETNLRGSIVLRACCTNFRRESRHVRYMLDVIREIGEGVTQSA